MNSVTFPNMQDFFLDKVSEGIIIKYADIIFGKYFIYILTPQNTLYPCIIYNHTMPFGEYAKRHRPFVHFCNCAWLWNMYDKDSVILRAKIPNSKLFDFQVGKNNSNKLFYNVELPFCDKCVEIYERLFFRFYANERFEIWNMLFSTKKVIKLEKIAIEDSINVDSRFGAMEFGAMEVEIDDGFFRLKRMQ